MGWAGKGYFGREEGDINILGEFSYWKILGDFGGFCFVCLLACFLGPHPQHKEVPRPGVKSELQLPFYATATAVRNPSCACDLHHSSQQGQILDTLSKARAKTCNFMVTSRMSFHCTTMGTLEDFSF